MLNLPKNESYQGINGAKFILCTGGIGDLLIGIAESYRRKKALLIFGANSETSFITEKIVDAFEIPYIIMKGSFAANLRAVYNDLSKNRGCLSTCHLPFYMNYEREWKKSDSYIARIPTSLPVQQLFGRVKNPKSTRRMIGIQPRGGYPISEIPTKYGNKTKIRLINNQELHLLVNKYADESTVFIVASDADRAYYDAIQHPNCFWLNTDAIRDCEGNVTQCCVEQMFATLNTCDEVIGIDSWLKIYSHYAGVKTTVVKTKYNGRYYDEVIDVSDNIFMDTRIWNFNIVTIEALIT